jgi:hypothetical protein
MKAIDAMIDGIQPSQKADVPLAIRKLATNKDIRIFLTALCKYSKSDWANFMKTCRTVYGVMQSSMLIKQDSDLMTEILRAPHIAMFFRRLTDEDT